MEEMKSIEHKKIDQAELLEEFDVESRFRRLSRNSTPGMIVFLACVGLALFHLYTAWTGPPL